MQVRRETKRYSIPSLPADEPFRAGRRRNGWRFGWTDRRLRSIEWPRNSRGHNQRHLAAISWRDRRTLRNDNDGRQLPLWIPGRRLGPNRRCCNAWLPRIQFSGASSLVPDGNSTSICISFGTAPSGSSNVTWSNEPTAAQGIGTSATSTTTCRGDSSMT